MTKMNRIYTYRDSKKYSIYIKDQVKFIQLFLGQDTSLTKKEFENITVTLPDRYSVYTLHNRIYNY